jgi:MFS family permease
MNLPLAPFRRAQFRLLFAGQLVSLLGTAVAPVALAFAVLDLTGSATDLGYVLAGAWLPQIVFVLVGGVVGDRVPRHFVMVGANVLSGCAQGTTALLLLTGSAEVWHLVVLQVARGAAVAFFFPASISVVPETVESDLLQQANALLRLAQSGSNVIGAAIGGVAVATIGPGWAIAFDAATYAASAAFFLRMRIGGALEAAAESFFRQLAEGWNEFRSRTWLWVVVVAASLGNMIWVGAFSVLGALVAKRYLGGAPSFGAIVAAEGAGLVTGGLLLLRFRPRRPLLVGCLALIPAAGFLFILATVHWTPAVCLAAFVGGIGLELFNVFWVTALQQHVPARVLSRVSSYDSLGSFVFIPLGLVLAGPAAAAFGLKETLIAGAAVGLVVVLSPLISRDVRELTWIEAPEPAPAGGRAVEPLAVGADPD